MTSLHQNTGLQGGSRNLSNRRFSSPRRHLKHEGLEEKTSLACNSCYQAALGLSSIPMGLGLEAPQWSCSSHRGDSWRCTANTQQALEETVEDVVLKYTHLSQKGGCGCVLHHSRRNKKVGLGCSPPSPTVAQRKRVMDGTAASAVCPGLQPTAVPAAQWEQDTRHHPTMGRDPELPSLCFPVA